MSDTRIKDGVAVDPDYFWRPINEHTPRGVKLQLLSKYGVAEHGSYDGKTDFWVGWTPLPKRRKEDVGPASQGSR
jgi:hypothetical protein